MTADLHPMYVSQLATLMPHNFEDWNTLLKNEDAGYIVKTRITWRGKRRVDILDRNSGEFKASYSVWKLAVKVNESFNTRLQTQEKRNQGNAIVATIRTLHQQTCDELDNACWVIRLIAFFRCEKFVPTRMFDVLDPNAGLPFTIQPFTSGLSSDVRYRTSYVEYTEKDYLEQ